MKITISNNLRLTDIPSKLGATLMETLRFPNPKWLENERLGRWNRGTPKELRFFDKVRDGGLWIPRGYIRQLILLCRRDGVSYQIDDRRRSLPDVNFNFNGSLKFFQKEAVQVMLAKEFGTLSAPTGSGKTVMALYIISRRKQPALIVVHTKDLAHQWVERIDEFLGIPAGEVGFIGGGKKIMGEKVTVALVQSLYK
ncbi:MAG: DEAD/DEAH box helicase family protein, partial [Proteobacteria bacterium]|nr:DEAD/DEAH box helicase family protein [Pseudomonadota bacterium]